MIHIRTEFLTVSQFAAKQKKHRQWVYEMIRQERIIPPPVKIAGVIFINKYAKIV